MKKKFYLLVAASLLCILAFFTAIFSYKLTRRSQIKEIKNEMALIPESASMPLSPEKLLSPTAHLDKLFKEAGHRQQLRDFEQKLIQMNRNGKRFWKESTPYKDPKYFQGLDTQKLSEECFSDGIFGIQMIVHDDPSYSIIKLRVCHNGFGELLRRQDLWAGILHAYEFLGKKISYSTEVDDFVQTSVTLDSLRKLFSFPDFNDQFHGHEDAMMKVLLEIIRKYRDLADSYIKNKEANYLFFCEPVDIADVFLTLAHQKNEMVEQSIRAQIKGFHFSQEQKMEELKQYLDLFIAAAEKHIK